jgi:hypothetical protein
VELLQGLRHVYAVAPLHQLDVQKHQVWTFALGRSKSGARIMCTGAYHMTHIDEHGGKVLRDERFVLHDEYPCTLHDQPASL